MLESLINVKFSMKNKESKEVVKEKFIQYCEEYDNIEPDAKIQDKIRHKEIFKTYINYMNNNSH